MGRWVAILLLLLLPCSSRIGLHCTSTTTASRPCEIAQHAKASSRRLALRMSEATLIVSSSITGSLPLRFPDRESVPGIARKLKQENGKAMAKQGTFKRLLQLAVRAHSIQVHGKRTRPPFVHGAF